MTMQLLQAKIRSLKGLDDTGWFKPGPKITHLYGDNSSAVSQILAGLQALNPLYEIAAADPFADYQKTWQQDTYQRPVIKEKKTAVFAVFSSGPELTKKLGLLDDSLFETDRIEFGRRLNYSRWVSFVELSASARWRDIADSMLVLRDDLLINSGIPDSFHESVFSSRKNSDRIKGDFAAKCREWLLANQSCWSGESFGRYSECLREVTLHDRFKVATNVVEEFLPPMILLQPKTPLQKEYSFAQLMSARVGFDPVAELLLLICRRFNLTSTNKEGFARLHQALSDVSSMQLLKKFPGTMAVGAEGFSIAGIDGSVSSPLARRLLLIKIIAMSGQLLWQNYPILLLDKYDRKITGKALNKLTGCVTEFGEYGQILVASDNHANPGVYDFDKRLLVASDGKVTDELEQKGKQRSVRA